MPDDTAKSAGATGFPSDFARTGDYDTFDRNS
jgi:hypothetical protein